MSVMWLEFLVMPASPLLDVVHHQLYGVLYCTQESVIILSRHVTHLNDTESILDNGPCHPKFSIGIPEYFGCPSITWHGRPKFWWTDWGPFYVAPCCICWDEGLYYCMNVALLLSSSGSSGRLTSASEAVELCSSSTSPGPISHASEQS